MDLNVSVQEGRLDCMSIIFALFILTHFIIVLDAIPIYFLAVIV